MARRTFGTVRKLPSGRWQARYSLDAGDRITAPHTFPTKGDAQRWLATVEADIARGTWHDPTLGHTTIAEWADRWLATKLPTVRRATADQYEYILRMYIVPHLGDRELGTFTPADVQAWLGMMHRRSGLAPNTVAKVYRLLKNMLGGAVEVGMIARNPCTIRGAGTERPPEIEVATPEQVTALADAWETTTERSSSSPPTAVSAGASSADSSGATSTSARVSSWSSRSSARSTASSRSMLRRPTPAGAALHCRRSPSTSSSGTCAPTSTRSPQASSSPPPRADTSDAATSAAGSGCLPPRRSASPASASTTSGTPAPPSPPRPVHRSER